jgi:hypothetical protein
MTLEETFLNARSRIAQWFFHSSSFSIPIPCADWGKDRRWIDVASNDQNAVPSLQPETGHNNSI